MTIWDRLGNLDRRYYYVLLIIVVAWPILKPWGLPVLTGSEARMFYDVIDAVPSGSIVYVSTDYRTDSVVELNPMLVTIYKQCHEKGLKIIMSSGIDEGALVSQVAVKPVADALGMQYGVDWINLGYKPGGDVTMKKMTDNFPEAVAHADMNGDPLSKFPIMNGFDKITKAALLICLHNIQPSPAQNWLKMVSLPTGMPMIIGTVSVSVPQEMPFFSGGQYHGLLSGLRGAAEYEFLTGNPGPALTGMDAQSAAHFLVILLIALGNLEYFVSRRKSKAPSGGTWQGGATS